MSMSFILPYWCETSLAFLLVTWKLSLEMRFEMGWMKQLKNPKR